jgi:hypothetical protein
VTEANAMKRRTCLQLASLAHFVPAGLERKRCVLRRGARDRKQSSESVRMQPEHKVNDRAAPPVPKVRPLALKRTMDLVE